MNPLVSVIIPTKNSEKFLGKCMDSIKNQTYQNIEIIVVDNNSTDRTKEIAKKFTDKVFNKGPERSAQFNFGSQKTKGEYLYRVDSDFILDKNVIKEALEQCEKGNFDAIAIHNTSDPIVSFWAKVRKFERDMYIDDELIVAARFFKKSSFQNIGGFDESLIAAEDYDLHNRLLAKGYKIGRIKFQEIHLGEPKTIWEIWQKSFFYGKTISRYLKKYPQKGRKQMNPLRQSFLKHWKELLWHPILTIGLLIMTLIKFGAGGIGLISAQLESRKNE